MHAKCLRCISLSIEQRLPAIEIQYGTFPCVLTMHVYTLKVSTVLSWYIYFGILSRVITQSRNCIKTSPCQLVYVRNRIFFNKSTHYMFIKEEYFQAFHLGILVMRMIRRGSGYHGSISVDSRNGNGSSFNIYRPKQNATFQNILNVFSCIKAFVFD